jgi:EAL domain-containing protein (putative c-di-GMP-specific phosphodiesterase class I)
MIIQHKLKIPILMLLIGSTVTSFMLDFKFLFIISIMGICVLLYQIDRCENNIVIAHNKKIHRQFNRKNITHYYVTVIEITNLANISQFYDANLADNIIKKLYKNLKKHLPYVYYYSSNQLIILNEFENKMVSMEQLRTEEQKDFIHLLLTHIKKQKFKMDEHNHYYKVNAVAGLGCSGNKETYNSIDALMKLAHFSLIQAKNKTLDYKIATEETRIIKADIEDLNKEIEKGLVSDEFSPYYLPIIDLNTMRIVGIESLLRWKKEKYRVIEAGKFKDIAEEKNIFEELDMIVFEKTLKDYSTWIKKGLIEPSVIITINVSKQTLINLSLQHLSNQLKKYNLKPQSIELDVSEQDLQDKEVLDTIKRLKGKHFKVSIDAFYSSTNSLHSLLNVDLNTIKLDRNNFPNNIDDHYNKRFYETFMYLSNSLEYSVIAKGIENKEHLSLAKELHIEFGQGYYFTKPLDSDNISVYLHKYKEGYNA